MLRLWTSDEFMESCCLQLVMIAMSGLEDLLPIPDAQRPELKKKALSGFFNNVQDSGPSSTTSPLHPDYSLRRRLRAFAPSWGSPPCALARLPQLFRHFQPNANEPIELQQRPGHSTSSRRSPPLVKVPVLDD
ncbi:hypothetical protein BDR05DRAFT_1062499 [Suillus weaverae]|nr:hypothetical protein BDR05DRAFT_1062499 [Suillus weaverae]